MALFIRQELGGKIHVADIEDLDLKPQTFCGKYINHSTSIEVKAGGITCDACLKKVAVLPKSIAKKHGLEGYVKY